MSSQTLRESSKRPIGHIDTVPEGEGRTITLAGRRITVFRTRAGQVFATQAECPHKAGPLADGILANTTIVCPLHEFKFELETGNPVGNSCESLKVFSVELDESGEMTISLDPAS